MRARLLGVVLAGLLTGLVPAVLPVPGHDAAAATPRRPAVVERRVIGWSVQGRPIVAWRVGDPDAPTTAVALAAMHGSEPAPRRILAAVRDGSPVHGVDLWLVPVANPDGVANATRGNARQVDLNRNFPYGWRSLTGATYSGPRPASERETRALMRFLGRVDPRFVVSFHQPLFGVDVSGPKQRWFARRLADAFHLPRKRLTCGGGCHGTMTMWFDHRFDGVAVTVELGRSPTAYRLEVSAPRQLLRALGGRAG